MTAKESERKFIAEFLKELGGMVERGQVLQFDRVEWDRSAGVLRGNVVYAATMEKLMIHVQLLEKSNLPREGENHG